MASIQGFYRGNITSLDNKLLQGSGIAMFAAILFFVAYLNAGSNRSYLQLAWLISIVIIGISLLVAGIWARRQEKKCVGLWRLMQTHPDVQLSLYLQQSGNTLSDVQKAARTINDAGAGLLVVDTVNDRLYDNRLSGRESITFQCQNCGANSTASFGLLEGTRVACQYCEAPAPDELLPNSDEKQENLVKSNAERMGLMFHSGKNQHGDINIPILIILVLVFWPAAVVYVINKSRSTS